MGLSTLFGSSKSGLEVVKNSRDFLNPVSWGQRLQGGTAGSWQEEAQMWVSTKGKLI